MITLSNNQDCAGCEACIQACPTTCITPRKDSEGFTYPSFDISRCINCNLCQKVCPQLVPDLAKTPILTLAAVHQNQTVRLESSSGGVFSALAEKIIEEGGIVYGAAFNDNWEVIHIGVDCMDKIKLLRSSKYVQSKIGKTFIDVKSQLNSKRLVLFTGTPCQISGLRLFLRKTYPNLLTIEVACHGVPSPLIWDTYLQHFKKKNNIGSIQFRDKSRGWSNYRFRILDLNKKTIYQKKNVYDPYMSCFLRHLSVRPSCFNCKSKAGVSDADILLGDLWGCDELSPKFDDNFGTSLVLVYSDNGKELLQKINIKTHKIDYNAAIAHNPAIIRSIMPSEQRQLFWAEFADAKDPYRIIHNFGRPLAPTKIQFIKTITYRYISKFLKK